MPSELNAAAGWGGGLAVAYPACERQWIQSCGPQIIVIIIKWNEIKQNEMPVIQGQEENLRCASPTCQVVRRAMTDSGLRVGTEKNICVKKENKVH